MRVWGGDGGGQGGGAGGGPAPHEIEHVPHDPTLQPYWVVAEAVFAAAAVAAAGTGPGVPTNIAAPGVAMEVCIAAFFPKHFT